MSFLKTTTKKHEIQQKDNNSDKMFNQTQQVKGW